MLCIRLPGSGGAPLLGDASITCQAVDASERHIGGENTQTQASRAPEGCPASQWVTTYSNHKFNIAPNLLDRNFTAESPNQKWAGDISYIWTRKGWLYLAVILDLHCRRVIGWAPLIDTVYRLSGSGQQSAET